MVARSNPFPIASAVMVTGPYSIVSFKNRPTSRLLKLTLPLKFSAGSIDAIKLASPKLLVNFAEVSKAFILPLKIKSKLIFSGMPMLSDKYGPAIITKSIFPEMNLRFGKS